MQADGRARGWTETWIAPAAAAGAAALVCLRSLGGAFVYDDTRFISDNPAVVRHVGWLRYFADPATVDSMGSHAIVRPLRTIDFALDWSLFGNSPAAFHVHSLLWHALAAALLCLVLRRLVGDGGAALAGALLWAVHPVQVESVAWISSRGDAAMGACSLLSILFALRAERVGGDLAVSLVAAAAAMCFKETAVALPLVVVALRWTGRARTPWWPHLVVAGGYLVYRFTVGGGDQSAGYVLGGSVVGTFATMFRAFGFYVVETLLPAQSLDWYLTPSTTILDGAALVWLAAHAALVASAVLARRRAPLWTLAVAWFYVFLLPVSNWPFFLGIPTTERFLYLPLAGVALAIAWTLARAPRAATTAALVAAAALGAQSAARTTMWRSDDELWRTALADHETPIGRTRLSRADVVEALALREEVARLPDGPERTAQAARGLALLEQALDHAHRAIAIWKRFELRERSESPRARLSETQAAGICWALGRDEEALFHAENAIRIDEAADSKPHFDRANALLALGFAPQAMTSMRRARDIDVTRTDAGMADFFLRAAEACQARRLFATAQAGFATALGLAPLGPQRGAIELRIRALGQERGRGDLAADDAAERAALTRLDDELARVPRTCPALELR